MKASLSDGKNFITAHLTCWNNKSHEKSQQRYEIDTSFTSLLTPTLNSEEEILVHVECRTKWGWKFKVYLGLEGGALVLKSLWWKISSLLSQQNPTTVPPPQKNFPSFISAQIYSQNNTPALLLVNWNRNIVKKNFFISIFLSRLDHNWIRCEKK